MKVHPQRRKDDKEPVEAQHPSFPLGYTERKPRKYGHSYLCNQEDSAGKEDVRSVRNVAQVVPHHSSLVILELTDMMLPSDSLQVEKSRSIRSWTYAPISMIWRPL